MMLGAVSSDEQVIVETFLDLKSGKAVDFQKMSEALFTWSQKRISP